MNERKRDGSWLAVLYRQYASVVYWASYALLHDSDLAEDVVQVVFARLWQNGPRQHKTTKGYFQRAAKNEAISLLRRAARSADALAKLERPQAFGNPEEVACRRDARTRILGLLNALPSRCQRVAKLRFQHELTVAEIAGELKISSKAVEKQLARARRHLGQFRVPK